MQENDSYKSRNYLATSKRKACFFKNKDTKVHDIPRKTVFFGGRQKSVGDFLKNIGDFFENVGDNFRNVGVFCCHLGEG